MLPHMLEDPEASSSLRVAPPTFQYHPPRVLVQGSIFSFKLLRRFGQDLNPQKRGRSPKGRKGMILQWFEREESGTAKWRSVLHLYQIWPKWEGHIVQQRSFFFLSSKDSNFCYPNLLFCVTMWFCLKKKKRRRSNSRV